MAKIDIKTQGVKGTEPKFQENKGLVTIFNVDDGNEYCGYISSDSFHGFGNDYKRREHNLIEIFSKDKGEVFSGNFKELIEKLTK